MTASGPKVAARANKNAATAAAIIPAHTHLKLVGLSAIVAKRSPLWFFMVVWEVQLPHPFSFHLCKPRKFLPVPVLSSISQLVLSYKPRLLKRVKQTQTWPTLWKLANNRRRLFLPSKRSRADNHLSAFSRMGMFAKFFLHLGGIILDVFVHKNL